MDAAPAPYPAHLVRERKLADGRWVRIRPVRGEDAPLLREFFAGLSPHARRMRFHDFGAALDDELLGFYTHIDYVRHMAFVCEWEQRIVGDARYVANRGTRSCELGIVVADDWHHTGIAQLLLDALLRAARGRGFETLQGLVLAENADMQGFVKELGFAAEPIEEAPSLVRVTRRLQELPSQR